MNDIEDKYGCSIEHFIEDKYSICREERQYSVFLYNILRKYNTENKRTDEDIVSIFDACGIPRKAKIQSVFYEATFMRDFFERNRRIIFGDEDCEKLEQRLLQKKFSPSNNKTLNKDISVFNFELIRYVNKNVSSIPETDKKYNLAHQKIACVDLSWEQKNTIMHMMNAKPDIAVIYYDDEKRENKLLFLECKFESYESSSKDGHKQRDIQWKIADFLCKYLKENLKEKIGIADKMDEEKSCIVKFVRKKSEDKKNANEIEIEKLIELNDKIFS